MPGLSVGQNSRDVGQTKKRTRAEEALAAAEQRRLAPVLRESPRAARLMAHVRRQSLPAQGELRRRGRSMRRTRRAAGVGMAASGHQGPAGRKIAKRGGRGRQFCRAGYRERVTISWPNCPFWEPLEFFMRNDGTMIRTDMAPAQPDIEAQFIELAASPWLPTALNADTRT